MSDVGRVGGNINNFNSQTVDNPHRRDPLKKSQSELDEADNRYFNS